MSSRTALEQKEFAKRARPRRIDRQAVKGLGGKGNDPLAVQDLDGRIKNDRVRGIEPGAEDFSNHGGK